MSQKYPSGKPTNYDRSLDRLTPDWHQMANPGLNAKGNFGSATHEVLKTSNKVLGGQAPVVPLKSPASNMILHGSPYQMPSVAGDNFQAKQIPNTAPKYPKQIASKVASRSFKEKSSSMIFHGQTIQKKI